jgi:hypothetical protein
MHFRTVELVDEARRELGQRKSFYPSFIAKGRLTPAVAERRILLQAAIVDRLEMLAHLEATSEEMRGKE